MQGQVGGLAVISVEEEHLTLVKRLLTASALRDWDRVRDVFHEDVVFHFPGNNSLSGEYRGMTEAVTMIARLTAWTGGTTRVTMHDILANEQHGVMMYNVRATHAGKSISYDYLDIYHFREGKISEVHGQVAGDYHAFDAFYSE